MMISEVERPDFLERHYTVAELAKAWHMGQRQVRAWFMNHPDVVRWGESRLTKTRKRAHVSLRIPESVARREYNARRKAKI
jgi:hypothetical protein